MEIHSSFFQPFFKPSPPSVGSGRCCIIIWSSVTPVPRHPFFWGVKSQKLVVMLPSPEDSKKKSGTTREKKGQIWWTPQPIKVKIVFFQHQATPKKNFPNSSLWIYEATCLSGIWFFLPAAMDRQITTSQVQRFSSFWFGGTAMGLFQFFFVSFRLRGGFLEEDVAAEDSGQKSTWRKKNGEKVLGTFWAAFSCCWVWIPLSLFAVTFW